MKFLQEELTFSERRACRAIEIDRKSMHYKPVEKDSPELLKLVRGIAERHPSYGYRRVHLMLKRKGVKMNLKRLRKKDLPTCRKPKRFRNSPATSASILEGLITFAEVL